jgi:sarcosine oxidase subunit gamma
LIPSDLEARTRLLGLGPADWLAVSDSIPGGQLHQRLAQYAGEQGIAAVNLSSGIRSIRVEGAEVREVLCKGCGLDLHPRSFGPGQCTRTRFAQLAVILDCKEPACFDLSVGRSYINYLRAWLIDAAAAHVN